MMDSIGNSIKVGDLVHYSGDAKMIGEVMELHDGGVSMRDGSKSPQTLVIVFKFTIAAPPRLPFRDIIVVKDPTKATLEENKIATA